MPIQKLLNKERYQSILNAAMKYAMEFDQPDDEIKGFISYIGREIGCDRCYVFEDDAEGSHTSLTYEWVSEQVVAVQAEMQNCSKEPLAGWYSRFQQGKPLVVADAEDIRHTDPPIYQKMKEQQVCSMILCPLIRRQRIFGFFGVDNPAIEEAESITVFLEMISTFLLSMLRRRNTFFQAQQDAVLRLYQALSQVYLSMHRINIQDGTFQIIKTNPIIENHRGITTLENFQSQVWAVGDAVVTPEYVDSFKEFTDLSTLAERLGDKVFIEHEFIGRRDGWCRQQFTVVARDEAGQILHVLYTTEIIEEAKQRENHLRYLAQTDMLTGLKNRGTGEHLMKRLIAQRQQGFLAVLDCDHFKSINDTFGHLIGDKVLTALGDAITKGIHRGDIAMRLGGDEFAIFMLDICDETNARIHIQHIFNEVAKIQIPELAMPLHISMGVAFFQPQSPVEFDALYQRADQCLYASKEHEGTYVSFYRES